MQGKGEKKARERGKAHRRLTRIYGFVGLANKESARETGFLQATLFHEQNRLLPLRARKHWILATFRISWPASTVNASGEFMDTLGFTSRGYAHGRTRKRGANGLGRSKEDQGETRRETRDVAEHVIRVDSLVALTRRIDVPFHAHLSFW